jgi:TPR repeat protein
MVKQNVKTDDFDRVQQLAEDGDPEAQYRIGMICKDERNDPKEAVKWYTLAAANKDHHLGHAAERILKNLCGM